MNSEASTPTLWVRVYTPDGYQAALTLPITSVADALAHFDAIRAAGLTATLPGLSAGELPGTITSCMKREKQNRDGSITPIIDMYPAWEGEFGRYRFVGVYLNTPEDVAEFEAHSGLKVKDMPLFESQVPLQRTAGITHKCEVACRPFDVIKKEDGMKEIGGKMMMTYELARYANAIPTPPAPPVDETPAAKQTPPPPTTQSPDGTGFTPDTARDFVAHWFKKEMLSTESILKALDIEAFGQWKQSVAAAHARVAQVVHALKPKGHDAPADAPLAKAAPNRH